MLHSAVIRSMPKPPKKKEEEGPVSLDDDGDSVEDSEEEEGLDEGHHDGGGGGQHADPSIKWLDENACLYCCGEWSPTAKLIGARHMPSTDDLKTIIVHMATIPNNPKTMLASCELLLFLLTEAPKIVIEARARYVWSCGILNLLIRGLHTFRKDISLVIFCLKCMSKILHHCPEGCVDTVLHSMLPDDILQLTVDYKSSVAKFGPIHAYCASCIDALCHHGGEEGRRRFGRRGVDAILSAFRSPAPTEELVRCLCQGLASICNDKKNSRCVFQPVKMTHGEKGKNKNKNKNKKNKKGRKRKKAVTTFSRGPSYFPVTVCRLFVSRDVRNNVEMLYRMIHMCNCVLLSAWIRPPTPKQLREAEQRAEKKREEEEEKDDEEEEGGGGEEEKEEEKDEEEWSDVYEGVALEDLGEAVMAIMKKWEHANLDTRCVQLLQTIGQVGSDDVRAKLSSAGLPQLLTSEFLEGVDTLPKDGCSNLLNAIRATTRGDIAVGECQQLLQSGMLEAILHVMGRHEKTANVQTAALNMVEHLGMLPATRWCVFDIGMDQSIVMALSNHSSDRSTVISVLKSLNRLSRLPTTQDEVDAANRVYEKERGLAQEKEEKKEEEEFAVVEEERRKKEEADFWDVDKKDEKEKKEEKKKEEEEKEEEVKKDEEATPATLVTKNVLPAERLFRRDLMTNIRTSMEKHRMDDGVIITTFQFLSSVLVAVGDKGRKTSLAKPSYDDDDVNGSATCQESFLTKSIMKTIPLILGIMRSNKNNARVLSASGYFLRTMSLSTNKLHDECVESGAPDIMLAAFLNDHHVKDSHSLPGILAGLSTFLSKEEIPRKGKKLSPMLLVFAGHSELNKSGDGLIDDCPTGFERVLETCCERHGKHSEVVVRSLELMSILLARIPTQILDHEHRAWIRGTVLRVVIYVLSLHPNDSCLLAAACQVVCGCMGTPKVSLQLMHNGLAKQLLDGLALHGKFNPNVVHGVCRVVYGLASSRTTRQILIQKFDGLKSTIKNLFGMWAGSNNKVKRWGKDCIGKLSLPC